MCEKLCIDTIDTIDTKSIYAYFSTHVDTHGMDTQMESSHMQWVNTQMDSSHMQWDTQMDSSHL